MLTAMLALMGALVEDPPAARASSLAPRPRSPDYVLRIPLPPARHQLKLPRIVGPDDPGRALVVLDPGHGGFDPGATGREGQEKAVALDLARAVRDALVSRGRVRVALTREDDRFLTLAERAVVARRLGADLFISLHAGGNGAGGAAVYTLAEHASDERAAKLAARENAPDRSIGGGAGGQPATFTGGSGSLSPRQIADRSAVLARLVARESARRLGYGPEPRRSAALALLRPLGVPSVLVDAGSVEGAAGARAGFAEAIARAVETYCSRLPPER